MISASRLMARAEYSGGVFRPVPMAVAPRFTSSSSSWQRLMDLISSRRVTAKAWNSWPRVMGTASCNWVRPIFRMLLNSWALVSKAAISASRAYRVVSVLLTTATRKPVG
ncbi:hypothetical protein D3C75_940500 [compost metagenome]